MPEDCARRGRRQRVPRWSAERRPGFLARGPRATGPPPPRNLGSRKLGVQAGRSQGWPKGADRKAPWAPPGAPSLSYGEGRKTGRRAHLGVRTTKSRDGGALAEMDGANRKVRDPDGSRRAGRQRPWIDLHDSTIEPDAVGREAFGERLRRAAIAEPVLVAVPRAGDAAVDDAAFAERSVLVGAEIGQRADLVAVAEHRDPLAAGCCDDAGRTVGNVARRADRDPAVIAGRRDPPLARDIPD